MRDLLLLFFAILLISLHLFLQLSQPLHYPPGATIKLTATLTQEPQTTSWNQQLTLEGFSVTLPRYPEYHLGDRIEVIGTISQKESPLPAAPLTKLEKRSGVSLSSVSVRQLPSRSTLFSLAGLLRRRAESLYQSTLPEPAAGLLSGIVWGGRQTLTPDLVEGLRRTGTLHIIAASGMNVTMAAGFLLPVLLLFIRRRWAVLVGILAIVFYMFAAGLSASVVRAGIMAIVFFLSQFFGRQYNVLRIFIMTTVLMLIIKPLWLFDVGWQLSVGATAGLLFIHPRICTRPGLVQPFSVRKLSNLGNLFLIVLRRLWSFIAADFWVSVAALLATQPILLANFGNLSFLAPIVNALVLWTIGPLMVLGFLMALGGPVATILGWISYLLLTFFVAVTQVFGQLNWAVLEGWRLHWLFGLLYYFGLIYLFLRRKQTPHA